jgi:hypothetical protein
MCESTVFVISAILSNLPRWLADAKRCSTEETIIPMYQISSAEREADEMHVPRSWYRAWI